MKWFLKKFNGDWERLKPWERPTMLLNGRASQRLAITVLALGIGNLVFFLIAGPYISVARAERLGSRTPLFQSHFYLLDVEDSPGFEIVWVLHCLTALLATLSYSGFDSFIEILVMHVCGKFSLLIDQIGKLNQPTDIRKNIAKVAKLHYQLKRFDSIFA